MFNLEEELKNLPELPGVYIMHAKDDTIIYVGKAKILKNRVRQYFGSNKNHSPKVVAMVSNIAYFEYIVTDSEVEALVLECNLIKKHRPKYNILLKDDKQYPYIKVTINKDYPSVFMTRTLKKDGAKYFGPFAGMQTVKTALEIVQKIFKPPLCKRKFPEDIGKGRPCLNFHISNCFGPCIKGNVSKDEYRKVFFDICAFLEGDHEKLVRNMREEMLEASKNMEFEKAASIRDKIDAIRKFEEKQKIINTDHQTDMDIIAGARLGNHYFVEIFFVRKGKITGRNNYRIDGTKDSLDGEVMSDFVTQFYAESEDIPREILVEYKIDDSGVIKDWLRAKRQGAIELLFPQKGEKRKLIEMVHKNAEIAAENYRINNIKLEEKKSKILSELAKKLSLEVIPKRIESYDISNIQGSDNVASMVVFVDGKPSKKDYRNFKIKSFEGQNDFLSMQEVIYRRFRHAIEEQNKIDEGTLKKENAKFLPLPDLILLDGGKGQLSSVMEIMETIDMEIPVFGMVKDSRHRTRGLVSTSGEIEISPIDSVFKFLERVQDEVHKSAIGYHRKLRSKALNKSELDNIKGIGDVRKAALMKAFKSVDNIKKASLSELLEVVDKRSADAIVQYFKEKN
ncbi:MAG: excinuclease ABC subunit UvrC [Clostridia bacterium]|nr:excinuclease ABC subunit UvrC [Clostridia bacterium]